MYKMIEVTVSLCNGLSLQIMSVKNFKYNKRNMLKICIEIVQRYVLFSSEENFEVSISFIVIACIRNCTETLIKWSKELCIYT
jgi:hypothetical protein